MVAEIASKIPGCRPLDAGELLERHRDRGVHGGAAPAQRALQDPGGPQADRHQVRRDASRRRAAAALRHGPPGRRAVRARPARHHVHVRHHALRRHPPGARHRLHAVRRAAAAADRPRPRGSLRAQHHRRRRLDPRQGPRARRPLPRPGRRRGGPLRGRHAAPSTSCPAASPGPRRPSPTSAASSAWCSTGATPTRPAVAVYFDVTTAPRLRHAQPLRRSRHAGVRRASGAATSTTRTSATRSTSCSGSRARPTSRRGRRCGARAARAGTSSARRWRCASWARRSTSTAAAPT